MKAYRTTETRDFMDCERKWQLKWVEKIKPTAIHQVHIAGAFGTAFHKAAEKHMTTSYPGPFTKQLIVSVATETFIKELSNIYHDPNLVQYYKNVEPYNLANLIKCVQAFVDSNLFDGYDIVAVEHKLKLGGTTADLILRTPAGELIVIDYKTHVCWNKQQRDQYIHEFETSWQMKHYCAATQMEFGEPCNTYMLVLIIPNMKRDIIYVQAYELPTNYAVKFLRNADWVWNAMEAVEKEYAPAIEHYTHWTRYGRCEFYDLCVTHNGDIDSSLLSGEYVRNES